MDGDIEKVIGDTTNATINKESAEPAKDVQAIIVPENEKEFREISKKFEVHGLDYVPVTLLFDYDFGLSQEFQDFLQERMNFSDETTDKEMYEWTDRLNKTSKAWHRNQHAKYDKLIDKTSVLEYLPIDYSPFVTVKLDKTVDIASKLAEMAKKDFVEKVVIKSGEDKVVNESFNDQLKTINAYSSVINNENFTSSYTRVGICEGEGNFDVGNAAFSNIRVKVVQNPYLPVSPHANMVADIINGVTRLDSLYCGNPMIDGGGLVWFINNNVTLINCSFGFTSYSYRVDRDGIFDYHIRNHFLTVIKSVGNASIENPTDRRITSPGYAKNIITVGATQTVGTGFLWLVKKEEIADYSCVSTDENKPLLCAPGTVETPHCGTDSGTSFAAALVTGSIAAMYSDILRNYPEKVQTLITMTANHTSDKTVGFNYNIGYYDMELGAGLMDLGKAKTHISFPNLASIVSVADTYRTNAATRTVSMSKNQIIKFSAHWSAINTATTVASVTDFDIRVYNSSRTLVALSALTSTNTETVIYKAAATETYSFEVYQYGNRVAPGISEIISYGYAFF